MFAKKKGGRSLPKITRWRSGVRLFCYVIEIVGGQRASMYLKDLRADCVRILDTLDMSVEGFARVRCRPIVIKRIASILVENDARELVATVGFQQGGRAVCPKSDEIVVVKVSIHFPSLHLVVN